MKIIGLFFSLFLFISTASAQEKQKQVNFDATFRKAYQGKAKVAIAEVKELLHIMIAITASGLENDDMVAQTGNYYKDVLKDFGAFKQEPIILTFDSLMKANPLNYIFLTGNALSYQFKGNKLKADKNYLFPAQSVSSHTTISINPITTYKEAIEQFAGKTKFRKFYKQHKGFYHQVITDYKKLANLQDQWNWLEQHFNTRVNNYTIMCSPLINGLNYTTSYTDNDFKQIMMVLPPVEKSSTLTEKQNQVFNMRVMFTEIDHNYVSAPTKANKEQIDIALRDRRKWIDTTKEGTAYYPTPTRVFDEYMTFAAFYLFCADQFAGDSATIRYAYNDINSILKTRGFIKAQAFNDELIRLKQNNPGKKVDDLYPELIEWCKRQ